MVTPAASASSQGSGRGPGAQVAMGVSGPETTVGVLAWASSGDPLPCRGTGGRALTRLVRRRCWAREGAGPARGSSRDQAGSQALATAAAGEPLATGLPGPPGHQEGL